MLQCAAPDRWPSLAASRAPGRSAPGRADWHRPQRPQFGNFRCAWRCPSTDAVRRRTSRPSSGSRSRRAPAPPAHRSGVRPRRCADHRAPDQPPSAPLPESPAPRRACDPGSFRQLPAILALRRRGFTRPKRAPIHSITSSSPCTQVSAFAPAILASPSYRG